VRSLSESNADGGSGWTGWGLSTAAVAVFAVPKLNQPWWQLHPIV